MMMMMKTGNNNNNNDEKQRQHALLSPSKAKRWLNCPPSARLEETIPDVTRTAAEEGRLAHLVAERKLLKQLFSDQKEEMLPIPICDEEMDRHTDGYVDFVYEELERSRRVGACKKPLISVEKELNLSRFAPECFGTADVLIVADRVITVIDFKYGAGIPVFAEENEQMKLYALGGLELYDGIYDISTVRMIIYQPRRDNVSVWEVHKDSLYNWADQVLKPGAELAFNGGGDQYGAGDWCRFCRASVLCRARADEMIRLAGQDFYTLPPLLSDTEITALLPRLGEIIAWANQVSKYALHEATKGKHWNGFKLVASRAVRKFSDSEQVAAVAMGNGFASDRIYEMKLLSVSEMEKLMGKKRFMELLDQYVEKPPGKPTLVPESDKRPEWVSSHSTSAWEDFLEDENKEELNHHE